jgi:hypothetical protein
MSRYLYFLFLGSWFFTSILVDGIAVPAVFRNVSKIAEAGTVGMIVFGRYNILEVFFSLGLLITAWQNRSLKYFKVLYGLLILLFINALNYTIYLSPSITNINKQLYNDETGSALKEQLRNTHEMFHQLYVSLEKGKVVILLFLMGLSFYLYYQKEKDRT